MYRYHTVQEFNKGVYDYIIATDESGAVEQDSESEEDEYEEDGTDCKLILISPDLS
jgi:ATP-dependent RNA helicase DDX56/DBP9